MEPEADTDLMGRLASGKIVSVSYRLWVTSKFLTSEYQRLNLMFSWFSFQQIFNPTFPGHRRSWNLARTEDPWWRHWRGRPRHKIRHRNLEAGRNFRGRIRIRNEPGNLDSEENRADCCGFEHRVFFGSKFFY